VRVLFLTKHDPVRYGQAEVLQRLAHSLASLGVEVEIFSSDPAARGARLSAGPRIHHGVLPIPGRRGRRRALHQLEALCEARDYSLVHAHGVRHPGSAAIALKRRLGLPFVATSHGDISDPSRLRRRRFRRHCRRVLGSADAVTHLSPAMEQRAEALGGVRGRSEQIPNGVDLAFWRAACEPVAGDYLLGLGRLVAQKGFEVLIDAVARSAHRGGTTSLVIAGDGEERSALAARASAHGLPVLESIDALRAQSRPALVLPGFVAGAAKRALFAGARGVALASQHGEASPLVLLEAFAAGRAVLASDLPSLRALLRSEHSGLRLAPRSPVDWADAIERLVRDEAWRKSCEAHNRAIALQRDWSVVAARYRDLYRALLVPPD